MLNDKNTLQKNHGICLEERKELSVKGVERVDFFSDREINLVTVMGKLLIKGEKLHIEKLNAETGDFFATGRVSSMVYSKAPSSGGSFLERLFK